MRNCSWLLKLCKIDSKGRSHNITELGKLTKVMDSLHLLKNPLILTVQLAVLLTGQYDCGAKGAHTSMENSADWRLSV